MLVVNSFLPDWERFFSSIPLSGRVFRLPYPWIWAKSRLAAVADSLQVHRFNQSLDDPLLSDFVLCSFRIRNTGTLISDSVTIRIKFEEGYKILDIKPVFRKPIGKSTAWRHSIPDLDWAMPDTIIEIPYGWDNPAPFAYIGFNIYESFAESLGYGRINPKIVRSPSYSFTYYPSDAVRDRYLQVRSITPNGVESTYTTSMKYSEFVAFLPLFRNVLWVDFTSSSDSGDGTMNRPFRNISKALEAGGPQEKIILCGDDGQYRKKSISPQS